MEFNNNKIIDIEKQLLEAIKINDINKVNKISKSENKSNIILNKEDENGNYPFLIATTLNFYEIAKLLIDIASKNNILLDINKKKIKMVIFHFWHLLQLIILRLLNY